MNDKKIILKSIEIKEIRGKEIDAEIKPFSIGNFNLLISDNAQGKTRLLRTFNFLSNLVSNKPRQINIEFFGKFIFSIDYSGIIKDVNYNIKIIPENNKNRYEEEIFSENEKIFSSKDKILINEKNNTKVEQFFIPPYIPAISSINEPDYKTINLINEFFSNIVFISASKSRKIIIHPEAVIPNSDGTNISSVLFNWSKRFPETFNEIVSEFIECFPFIKNIKFHEEIINGIKVKILKFKENNITNYIDQANWSDGIFRILHLLISAKVPFFKAGEQVLPSMILIDEIENGLDFKRLKYIINYLQDHSDDSQILISSHSPLVCDFIHPKNWIIVKRDGPIISFISPKEKESNLQVALDLFKQKHWDFYTKHISNSSLYKANE